MTTSPDSVAEARFSGPVQVADYHCEIGENPLWHPLEKRLYWCDIPRGRLFRYDPKTGSHELCHQGRPIGGFTIQADGSLLLFMDAGAVGIWREGRVELMWDEMQDEKSNRFNDVIADPVGRVFCGTMSTPERKGRLYRLDLDGSIHLLLEGIGCSNGMAFTLDHKHLYYTDSLVRRIYLFDYDRESGALSKQRVFAELRTDDGLPDGATLDSAGCLWSAWWDGGCIVRYLPDGKLAQRIEIPARKASSVAFGGDDYSDLYVTTAGGESPQQEGKLAGSLFRLRVPVPGLPEFFSRIRPDQGRTSVLKQFLRPDRA